MHLTFKRLVAAGSAALVASVGLAPTPVATAATEPSLTKAANYLARNLPSADDGVGAALTTANALAATGSCTYAPAVRTLVSRIQSGAKGYLYPGGKLNQARAASLAVTLNGLGLDPRKFAGFNVAGLIRSGLPKDGRIGATPSTFSQSLAILGLQRSDTYIPVTVLTKLLSLQTGDGGFGYESQGTVTADGDSTGMALFALQAIGELDPQADAAVDWALDAQLPDGSFPNQFSPVDTTGIVGAAVLAAGETAAAAAATTWLGTQQLPDGGFPATRDGDDSNPMATASAIWLVAKKTPLDFELNLSGCPANPPSLPAATTACTGVWVVVDRGNGQSTTRCATSYANGLAALKSAGFTTKTTDTQFGPFLCQISGFPSTCTSTSDTYWGYWTATQNPDGTWSQWTESQAGAATSKPVQGTVEGWIYGPWLGNAQPDLATPPLGYETVSVPTLTGTAKVGQTLTASTGTWDPQPAFSYRWYRSGSYISGATKATYKLTSSDVGKTIQVRVTGTLAGHQTVSRTSLPTVKVVK